MAVRQQQPGYVRCEMLMPVLASKIMPISESPSRRVLALLTEDGSLALGITAEAAQEMADQLTKAAADMRKAG
jgi:hypothetical protein